MLNNQTDKKTNHPLSDTAMIQNIIDHIGHKILDKEQQITIILAALIAGGHVLVEDLPGLGKTTLATAIAQTFGMDYNRIQLTSDMMPSDVLGVSIYDAPSQTFSYHKGPIFTQFLLADELNRATPKTQSALLEAMAENQISMDGETYPLDAIFFVMATQNPIDEAGTYSLPQSQLDRFLVSLSLGYPDHASERKLYGSEYLQTFNKPLQALASPEQLSQWQSKAKLIHANDEVLDYLQLLIQKTRNHSQIQHGLSPRAGLSLFKLAQGLAFIADRTFITPADIQRAFFPVSRHRLTTVDGSSAGDIIESIIHDTPII
ncbi:AAA family ATPase [Marinicella litoralis]|uniref:MoxR-like ATPase n=2 Tax=Marinicella litoralis TaxID=644220 RepID=A0A4R6XTH3_9GAMM|nr:MoxR family ATPase [Marinicella litoralis]TDR20743.1 MoxR-like ATPase [Marinicella litoralis]